MSSLWTPSGEKPVESSASSSGSRATDRSPVPPHDHRDHGAHDHDGHDGHDEAAELAQLQSELRATPAADIIANHAIGLWQLAVLHLGLDDPSMANLPEASLAIDAMGAMVDKLAGRLGAHAEPLTDALTQLRMAFVQQSRRLNPT